MFKAIKKLLGGKGSAMLGAAVALIVALVIGWIANLVKLIGLIGDPFSAEVVIRAVGVFAVPLGMVAGYF